MKKTIIGCALIILMGNVYADSENVWKWVDDKGQTIYSNNPPPKGKKSEKLDLIKYPAAMPQITLPNQGGMASWPPLPAGQQAPFVGAPLSQGGPIPSLPPMTLPNEMPGFQMQTPQNVPQQSQMQPSQQVQQKTTVQQPVQQPQVISNTPQVIPGLSPSVPKSKKLPDNVDTKDPFSKTE